MGCSRRLLVGGALAAVLGLSACDKGGGARPSASRVTTVRMEPLTLPVPQGLTPWSQPSAGEVFYWDRAWVSDTEDLPTSLLVLARLWGQGAAGEVSAAAAVDSLRSLLGSPVSVGTVQDLGSGSWRQELTSESGAGALWSLTNGISTACIILFGPQGAEGVGMEDFSSALAIDDEPETPGPPSGWQVRRAAGLALAVGATWSDVGTPTAVDGAAAWRRGFVDRGSDVPRAIMVTDGLGGASVTEAVAAFLDVPGITSLRDGATTSFQTGALAGQRVDFRWGDGVDRPGSMWAVRDGETNRCALLLDWSDGAETARGREVVEGSLALDDPA